MLFKNALIIDGTGNKPFVSDVEVKNDTIIRIGKTENRDNQINCSGLLLCPGFIDIHAHSELEALRHPSMSAKKNQGITTDISGNCGIGTFPCRPEYSGLFSSILGDSPTPWNWTDFTSFTEKLHPGINMGFLQSHSMLRIMAMHGCPNRAADDSEIANMVSLLDISLQQGALGLSSGLYYAPCFYAEEKEMIALLKTVKKHDKLFAVHQRCEGSDIISSLKEIINLTNKTGVKTEISHLKIIGIKNQGLLDEVLSLIENTENMTFDQYPYEYGSTSLLSMLPPSFLSLPEKDLHKALGSKTEQDKIKQMMENPDGWDSIAALVGWDNIYTSSNEAFSSIEKDPYKLFFKIVYDNPDAIMRDITQTEDSIIKIMRHPLGVFSTDALYTKKVCHPRSYSCTVHYLDKYIKQNHVLSFEEAIHRMTGKTALRLEIKDRGFIKEGMKADIVLLNREKLKDTATPLNPTNPPEGIEMVMVNGEQQKGTII